jgi:hypothetical protein
VEPVPTDKFPPISKLPPEETLSVAELPALTLFCTVKFPVPPTESELELFTVIELILTVPFAVSVKAFVKTRFPVIIKVPPLLTVIPSPF